MSKVVELVPKNTETPEHIAEALRELCERTIRMSPGIIAALLVVEKFPNPLRRCEIAGSVPDSMSVTGGLARYAFLMTESAAPPDQSIEEPEDEDE